MNIKNLSIIGIIISLSFIGYKYIDKSKNIKSVSHEQNGEKIEAVVFKSPTCGCCVGFTSYINTQGFDAQIQTQENMDAIKEKHNIPLDMQSCHTTVIGDYFVEGHIPVEAINKLLAEKPDVDGTALPGMPAGSPGMGGKKLEEFVIYSLKNGVSSVFMTL